MHPGAELKFPLVEAGEIMPRSELNGIMIGKICLQNTLAGGLPAPSTARHLREQLKGSLRCAKIWQAQRHIRTNHSNQCDAMYIVPFGDHLGADKHVEFAFVQRVESAFEIFPPADGVTIEAADARLWKHAVQELFQLFRSRSDEVDVLTAAVRALVRDVGHVSAVVTFHFAFAFVMRHRDGTVFALERLPAGTAENHRRVSAAV